MEYNAKLPGPINLFKESFETYRQKFKSLISISAIIFLAALLVETVWPAPMLDGRPVFALDNFIGNVAVGIISLLCTIAIIYVINDNLGARDALSRAPKVFWKYFLTSIMVGIVVGIGFVLLIVPGIIFSAWFGFAGMIVILEGSWAIAAMKKSKEYVKGHTGEVILRWLFILLLCMLVGAAPAGILANKSQVVSNLYTSVLFLFIYPLIEIYLYRMYTHLKNIKQEAPAAVEPVQPQSPQ